MITPRNYRTDYDPHTDWGCDIPSLSELDDEYPIHYRASEITHIDDMGDLDARLAELQAHVNGRRTA